MNISIALEQTILTIAAWKANKRCNLKFLLTYKIGIFHTYSTFSRERTQKYFSQQIGITVEKISKIYFEESTQNEKIFNFSNDFFNIPP